MRFESDILVVMFRGLALDYIYYWNLVRIHTLCTAWVELGRTEGMPYPVLLDTIYYSSSI